MGLSFFSLIAHWLIFVWLSQLHLAVSPRRRLGTGLHYGDGTIGSAHSRGSPLSSYSLIPRDNLDLQCGSISTTISNVAWVFPLFYIVDALGSPQIAVCRHLQLYVLLKLPFSNYLWTCSIGLGPWPCSHGLVSSSCSPPWAAGAPPWSPTAASDLLVASYPSKDGKRPWFSHHWLELSLGPPSTKPGLHLPLLGPPSQGKINWILSTKQRSPFHTVYYNNLHTLYLVLLF